MMRRTVTNPSIFPVLALLAAFAFRPVVVFAAVPDTPLAPTSAGHCHKTDGSALQKAQSANPFRIVAKWTASDDLLFPGFSRGNNSELSGSLPKASLHPLASIHKPLLVLRI